MLSMVIDSISSFMYSKLLVIMLIGTGVYFTIRTKFPQVRLFRSACKAVMEKPDDEDAVSSFQALMVSTASRVGTGNIVGVSSAICIGGFGAVFWMWVIAIIGSASAFVESTLAQIYKKKGEDGTCYGGPAYYIEAALRCRPLAIAFCIAMIATYAFGFNMLASYNLQSTFAGFSFYHADVTPWIIGGILAVLTGWCLLGGGSRIVKVTSTLVPVMGVAYIVVALIVVVINMIVGAIPSKYSQLDVSSSKLYTIGDETKKVLKALDKDVTIYQIAASGSEDDTISNLLSRYKDESKHIKVEVKDPVVNPKFASEYTTDDLASNSLIVVCGDRNKVINYNDMYSSSVDYNTWQQTTTGFDGEGQITSAIGYVTSEDLPIMYTLSGHGEKDLDSSFKEDIQKANIDIKELNLLTEGKVPDDADCLMIVSPTSDISEEEKTELLDYLEAGGKAMIFSDYTQDDLPNFDAVLENYGVKCAEGIVFEGDNQHYGMQMPYYLVPTVNSTDASSETASAGSYVLAPYAQGIQKTDDVRDTVTIDSILTTSDKAYSKTNMQSSNIEKEDGDVDGPFDLGVAITEKLDDDKETQIVYYSTANLMESQINQMVSGGNEKLLLESLNWMTSTDDSNSVSIPSKSLESTSLTVTDYDAAFWKICTIGLIPGVFLVAGFLIWLKRRKA